jgi:uncharacterized protein (DUF488 family)
VTTQIYTLGYTGRQPADLAALVNQLDATLFDIRFSPMSRIPHWRRSALESLLGDRYRWVQALGNRNYKNGGRIELVDYEAGLREIETNLVMNNRPVILMCACKDYSLCHRSMLAVMLSKVGYKVKEIKK